ncbi:MAG: dTMP kinase [Alphaproteobacteria bacterium]|nr:dTMP kinase [Alphaproteobacteria bacterium]
MRGRFLSLEGGEGSGKSTQAIFLVEFLARRGISAVATREVGGTQGAEDIRELWLGKRQGFWDPLTEVMLIMAARREHLQKVILPALEKGQWVISDRYVDSTRVYQGIGQGVGLEKVDAVYREIAGDFWPDRTFLLDLPVRQGLSRMHARSTQSDRFEDREETFHETLRQAFLDLATKEGDRFTIIDASQTPQQVRGQIEKAVEDLC